MNVTSARTILGIRHEHPSTDEVRVAWRRFARENHPDVRPGDPAAATRFVVGRDAYDTLNGQAPAAPVRRFAREPHDAGTYRPAAGGRIVKGPEAAAAHPYAFGHVTLREWQA